MSVILLNTSIVHYEVLGRGRPVIFLHGWFGSWRYWVSAMQAASISFRAYALDFWGFGGTSHQPDQPEMYNLRNQTELLRKFLDEMGIGKIALVGHGWGALIALDFTAKFPDLVDRVMIANYPLDIQSVHAKLKNESLENLIGSLKNTESEIALSEAHNADPKAISASLEGILDNELFAKVNRQYTPCLLVSSGKDSFINPPSEEQLKGLSEFGHHIFLDEAGHFPMLDSEAKFNRLLIDFLALDSGLSIKELALKEEWKRRVR